MHFNYDTNKKWFAPKEFCDVLQSNGANERQTIGSTQSKFIFKQNMFYNAYQLTFSVQSYVLLSIKSSIVFLGKTFKVAQHFVHALFNDWTHLSEL